MTKRTLCSRCLKPTQTCLCDLITDINNPVEVIIWQHPNEAQHSKNTATLLQLSLRNTRTLVAEELTEDEFNRWLGEPDKINLLLSPLGPPQNSDDQRALATDFSWSGKTEVGTHPNPGSEESTSKTSTQLSAATQKATRLIVIDGTWRKARKICHLNPWLSNYSVLDLPNTYDSHYSIRKSERPHQYATLEAVCLGLSMLEQASSSPPSSAPSSTPSSTPKDEHLTATYEPLIASFHLWIKRLAALTNK